MGLTDRDGNSNGLKGVRNSSNKKGASRGIVRSSLERKKPRKCREETRRKVSKQCDTGCSLTRLRRRKSSDVQGPPSYRQIEIRRVSQTELQNMSKITLLNNFTDLIFILIKP